MATFSGSAKYYDVILGDAISKSCVFVDKLLKQYDVKTILELGCGTGLYLFPLRKAGFDVEGLDISEEMLQEAAKKGKVKLYKKDMSRFRLGKKYDAIICMNSSLVLLSTYEMMEQTLQKCKQHLNDRGILILDLPNHDKEIQASNYSQEIETYKIPKGKIDVIFRDYTKKNKWVSEWYGFVQKEKEYDTFKEYYEELIYSPQKLEQSLVSSGFTILSRFGSRVGGPFHKDKSYRRFIVCQKL